MPEIYYYIQKWNFHKFGGSHEPKMSVLLNAWCCTFHNHSHVYVERIKAFTNSLVRGDKGVTTRGGGPIKLTHDCLITCEMPSSFDSKDSIEFLQSSQASSTSQWLQSEIHLNKNNYFFFLALSLLYSTTVQFQLCNCLMTRVC